MDDVTRPKEWFTKLNLVEEQGLKYRIEGLKLVLKFIIYFYLQGLEKRISFKKVVLTKKKKKKKTIKN